MIDLTRPHGLEPGTVLMRYTFTRDFDGLLHIAEIHYCLHRQTIPINVLFDDDPPCACGAKPPRREEAGSLISHPELMPGAPAPSLNPELQRLMAEQGRLEIDLLHEHGSEPYTVTTQIAQPAAGLYNTIPDEAKRLGITPWAAGVWTGMPEAAYEEHVCRDGKVVIRRGPEALKLCLDCGPGGPPSMRISAVDPAAKSVTFTALTTAKAPPGEWRCTCGSSFPDEGSEHHLAAEKHHMEFFKSPEEFTARMLAQFAPAAPRGCRMEPADASWHPIPNMWQFFFDDDKGRDGWWVRCNRDGGSEVFVGGADGAPLTYEVEPPPRPGERFWLTFTDAAGRESETGEIMTPVPYQGGPLSRANANAPASEPTEASVPGHSTVPGDVTPTRCPVCGEVANHVEFGIHCRGKP